jgi:hypothetical protein
VHAVKKAHPKLPDTTATLLIINDDLQVSLLDWHTTSIMERALYASRMRRHFCEANRRVTDRQAAA